MRTFFVTFLFLTACRTVDLTSRPQWSLLPSCLVVHTLPYSWQSDVVMLAAAEWNHRLERDAFHVAPMCEPTDEYVPFSFLRELPDDCPSLYGCTYTTPYGRWVVIDQFAPYSTLVHEIGHLAGCHHEDLDPPCSMGVDLVQ